MSLKKENDELYVSVKKQDAKLADNLNTIMKLEKIIEVYEGALKMYAAKYNYRENENYCGNGGDDLGYIVYFNWDKARLAIEQVKKIREGK